MKNRRLPLILASIAMFTLSACQSPAGIEERPLALVYNGPGACWPCINGAAKVAEMSGFEVRTVDQNFRDFSLFDKAKLWIQPGGQSSRAAKAMGAEYLEAIRHFVDQGGGYVGFCAGAFLSTQMIGTTQNTGLGILPGSTRYHIEEDDASAQMEKVKTLDGDRWIFFSGGPQFIVSEEELKAVQGRATAWAADGQIIALEAHYGKGKISVSGFHPEASALWKGERLFVAGPHGYLRAAVQVLGVLEAPVVGPIGLAVPLIWPSPYFSLDQDGDDYQFATGMIRYASPESPSVGMGEPMPD